MPAKSHRINEPRVVNVLITQAARCVERECPNCKSKFTYQGSDLKFQSDRKP
jgi:hypothetical protein